MNTKKSESNDSATGAVSATSAIPQLHAAKPGKLLRMPAVEDRTGQKKSSMYAGVKAGTFPAPVRLSARCVAWREEDIDKWISERVATVGTR